MEEEKLNNKKKGKQQQNYSNWKGKKVMKSWKRKS